jgi:hypothetical protein
LQSQFPFCRGVATHYIDASWFERQRTDEMGFSAPLSKDQASLLDERSREIFRRIVEGYLDTGEPLGSRSLSRLLPMSLSPASVRNVMSDLEELGLIYSPHISAGRLPTQTGLRFFVDAFMQVWVTCPPRKGRLSTVRSGRSPATNSRWKGF